MNDLEQLLVRATADPAARPLFYEKLAGATLYVLTPARNGVAGERTLEADEQVQIVHWQGPDGEIVPMFSSLEVLREILGPESPYGYFGMEGRTLFEVLSQQPGPAVLNPNWSYGRKFLPEEIARLAAGTFAEPSRSEVVQQGRSVLVGSPKEYPHAMVEALKSYFAGTPEVKAAHLALYVDTSVGPEPRLVVTIACAGDPANVVRGAGVVAREVLTGGQTVDFTTIAPGAAAPLAGGTPPFYER